ncbi:MAG: DNA-3-methyladenine glycosylase [Spirosomataceae bacterium]
MLPLEFYQSKDTLTLAQQLLGCTLVHQHPEGTTSGIIVETEAYLENDPASHSYRGKTARNQAMFGRAGTAYVYLIYGMYDCFNIVSNQEGIGEAVLIRALEPIEGIELMQKRRNTEKVLNLCSGPGKLVKAMGLGREDDGIELIGKIHCLEKTNPDIAIRSSSRIGITKGLEHHYRFYIEGNRFVSRKISLP